MRQVDNHLKLRRLRRTLQDFEDNCGRLISVCGRKFGERGLQRLDGQRRCVLLAFVDGFSHVDIADALKAPLGSVKSWVRRGLIALKGCLQP